jgi:hypothetical protein
MPGNPQSCHARNMQIFPGLKATCWRGGDQECIYGSGLENRRGFALTVGSNPTASARPARIAAPSPHRARDGSDTNSSTKGG